MAEKRKISDISFSGKTVMAENPIENGHEHKILTRHGRGIGIAVEFTAAGNDCIQIDIKKKACYSK